MNYTTNITYNTVQLAVNSKLPAHKYRHWRSTATAFCPTITTNSANTNTHLFARGYTGHEHLDKFGLINMNGRMYDPMLGRFLSPDNYVQAPDNSQNFNRYSYCLNNPLRYTDPSGDFWFVPLIVGFVTNYTVTGITTNNWGWKAIENGAIGGLSALVGYGVGMAANSIASTSLGLSTSASAVFGSTVGGSASGAFSSLLTGQNIGIGAAIGLGGGLLGGVLGDISKIGSQSLKIGDQALLNIAAGGLYGGAVSSAMGGNFWDGFKTGAISSAVGFGVSRGMKQYLAKSQERIQASQQAKELAKVKAEYVEQQLKSWKDSDIRSKYDGADASQRWGKLNELWNETYGNDPNLKASNNFDLSSPGALKFNNLHIRYEGSTIESHIDYIDIVKNPLGHILIDTIYQGFRYWDW